MIHFGQLVDAIAFDRSVEAVPLLTAEPEVARYLELTADSWLARHAIGDGTHLHASVTGAIEETLELGRSDVVEVARRLGMSPRTPLQRALTEQNLSFRRILDEVRWSIAEPLLVASDLPIDRIAERLGYADGKAFRRAFRRWKGIRPGDASTWWLKRSGNARRFGRGPSKVRGLFVAIHRGFSGRARSRW